MKKFFAICLMVTMFLSLSISAFATGGGFVTSPSKQKAPKIVASVGSGESGEVEISLSVTAYGDRTELKEETRQIMEEAYTAIMETQNIVELNTEVKEVIENILVDLNAKIAIENEGKNEGEEKDEVKSENLAVSEFFDISDEEATEAGNYSVTIKTETLANFVCLLHYYDGDWHVVEDARVSDDGEHLEFSVGGLSPFAIVVDTGAGDVAPQTSNNGWIIAVSVIAVGLVLGGAATFFVIKYKKSKA